MKQTEAAGGSQFAIPADKSEATRRRQGLITKIMAIRSQLAQGKKFGVVPSAFSGSRNYHEWRTELVECMEKMEQEALFLKPYSVPPTQRKVLVARERQLAEFIEPKSLTEATERNITIIGEIQAIQSQLSNKVRIGADGNRISPEDFMKWRTSAIRAMQILLEEKRLLKEWIHNRNQLINGVVLDNLDLTEPLDLLRGARMLIRKHVQFDSLSDDEKVLLTGIDNYLHR